MIVDDIRKSIYNINEDAVLFNNPAFDNSIIGLTTDGVVVYLLSKMIDELAIDDDLSTDEAYEFIDYNTIRSLNYINIQNKPIIVDDETIL